MQVIREYGSPTMGLRIAGCKARMLEGSLDATCIYRSRFSANFLTFYYLKRNARPYLENIDCIEIDETSIGKGHRYLTVVLNLKTGAVIFVGEGKGADALKPFFTP